MVSQHERERLTEAFKRELLIGAAVVIKCVAGLLVVVALAVIGVQTDTIDATATTASQPQSETYEKESMAYGKMLFQESQTRLEPALAGAASQIFSASAADTQNPNRISSLPQRGAAPVNSPQN